MPSPPARLGLAIWGLLTSVNFAVAQITFLALLAVVGMTIRQLPSFAFRSLGDYQAEMEKLRVIYDSMLGGGVVDAMERLQLFNVFTSPWFSVGLFVLVISIVVCTLDRTPRLWQQAADVRVVQPDAYFDPMLPDRAVIPGSAGAAAVGGILRRHGFRVRTAGGTGPVTPGAAGEVIPGGAGAAIRGPAGAVTPGAAATLTPGAARQLTRGGAGAETRGAVYLYGDRHQWTKLATLISHLGLILFLLAAAVTSRFGDEQGLVVAEGDSLTVGPIGTPGLLLVRNFGFEAPGFETGNPTDFTTDLAVYRDGQLLARKVVRVNDPLEVGGYSFHQNGFGPAPHLLIADRTGGTLWSGPVPLTEQHEGFPFGLLSVPGRDVGLQILLNRAAGGGAVLLILPYRVTGTNTDGSPVLTVLEPMAIAPGERQAVAGIDFTVGFESMADYTVLIARNDPGQGIVWGAFAALITGLSITFYLPRRRVWARLAPDGELALVGRSDRYVDHEKEFGRLLDDLVAARPGGRAGAGGAGGAGRAVDPPHGGGGGAGLGAGGDPGAGGGAGGAVAAARRGTSGSAR